MLQRKAKAQFESWLASSPNKALLVKGARQVGKSYLVNVFASESFENVVTFDLIADASVRDSFLAAKSADDLLMRMSIAATQPMVANKTVVVIDEVQRCPNVVTFIKYLVQRGDFRYILTGSLLGVELEGIDSLPVGYVEQVQMCPLDFEEFCWANGVGASVFDMLRDCLKDEGSSPATCMTACSICSISMWWWEACPTRSIPSWRRAMSTRFETSIAIFTPCIAMTSQSTLRPSYAWLFAISMI